MTHPTVKPGFMVALAVFGISVAQADYIVDQSMTLTDDHNWQHEGTITIPAGVTVDLAGHKLFVGHIVGGGEITDTSASAGGELHVVVPTGCAYGNQSVFISGNLKLVKDGEGSLELAKAGQSYTGGTDVDQGTLVFATASNPAGAKETTVKVAAGATLDMNGVLNPSCVYNYDLAGTVLQYTSAQGWNTSDRCFGDITLSGDATIRGTGFLFSNPTKEIGLIAFNGHKLTLDIRNANGIGGYIAFGARTDDGAEGGTLEVTGSGCLENGDGYGCAHSRFVVKTPSFKVNKSFSVGGFEYKGKSWQSNNGTPMLYVSGCYIAGAMRPPLTMQSGSTLDLSTIDDVWSADGFAPTKLKGSSNEFTDSGRVSFAANATITVDLSERVLFDGEQVASWSSLPSATFVLDDVSALAYDLLVNDSGIFVAYKHKENDVMRAVWTGEGDKDNPNDPGNWRCTDVNGQIISGYPWVLTEVIVNAPVTMNVPAGTKVYCKSITITDTAALSSDCDWRGFVKPTINGRLDLAGHRLRISALRGDGEITDTSSGEPGELHVDVPYNVNELNTSITISGNLKLVKDGEGSLELAKAGQSYTGGTDVDQGTLVYGTASNPAGAKETTVKVAAGATLDMNGVLNPSCVYNYDLAGTVLQYTSAQGWNTSDRCFGDITLSGDATIRGTGFLFSNPTKEIGLIAFNGHKLTLDIRNANGIGGYCGFGAWTDDAEGGTLEMTGKGHELLKGISFNRVRIVVTAENFKVNGSTDIRCEFSYGSNAWLSHRGTPVLEIYGGYVALGAMRPRLNMHDGSTLDLSALDAALNCDGIAPRGLGKSDNTFNEPGLMTFDDNATITVDLGSRRVQSGDQVVSWSAGAKPPAGVKFRSAPGTNCGFAVKDDGLYVVKGLTVILK